MQKLKLHVYTICWNESRLLPFFIKYYQQFAEKIFFYDNESTDNSREIIEASDKCYYRSYCTDGEFRDDVIKKIKNNSWKESRGEADFVIVVDLDEFVYSRNLIRSLRFLKKVGVSLITPRGYDMMTRDFNWNADNQITEMVQHGMKQEHMNKSCLFDPNKVEEINFKAGAHKARMKGKGLHYGAKGLLDLGPKFKLLHYKFLTLQHVLERNKLLGQRLSQMNIQNKHGLHYLKSEELMSNEFHSNLTSTIRVI